MYQAHRGVAASNGGAREFLPLSNQLRSTMILRIAASVTAVRNFLGLMALMCCALGIALPSSARSAHLLDHAQSPVAAGVLHHHHDEVVDAARSDHEQPTKNGDSPGGKFSHSHMPGSVSDLTAAPQHRFAPASRPGDDVHVHGDTPSPATLGWIPPVRPPRTA